MTWRLECSVASWDCVPTCICTGLCKLFQILKELPILLSSHVSTKRVFFKWLEIIFATICKVECTKSGLYFQTAISVFLFLSCDVDSQAGRVLPNHLKSNVWNVLSEIDFCLMTFIITAFKNEVLCRKVSYIRWNQLSRLSNYPRPRCTVSHSRLARNVFKINKLRSLVKKVYTKKNTGVTCIFPF